MPCESWPLRLASTRLVDTRSASRSDEPVALTMARMVDVRGAALSVWVLAMDVRWVGKKFLNDLAGVHEAHGVESVLDRAHDVELYDRLVALDFLAL